MPALSGLLASLATTVTDLRTYIAQESLEDGTAVTVRAIRREDQDALRAVFENLDVESFYRRFLGPKKELTDADLAQFTDLDFVQVVDLVVLTQTQDGEALIAGGRFAENPASPGSAELAFTTDKRYRGRGLANLILRHLARIARDLGISRLEGDVLADNQPMLAVLRRSGLPMQQQKDGNVIHVILSL
jgi:RimJ/RimL family protein N-acetyltransferase